MTYASSNVSGFDFTIPIPVTDTGRAVGVNPPPALGTLVQGTGGSVWLLCLVGSGGITDASYVCLLDEAFSAVMLEDDNAVLDGKLGVAACAAEEGDYVWLQVYGPADIQVAASCTANVTLYTTNDAGVLDDATSTIALAGIVLTAARAASQGTAPAVLNWPICAATGSGEVFNVIYGPDNVLYGSDEVIYG